MPAFAPMSTASCPLQRSHALSGVETTVPPETTWAQVDLQRSHALSGVETAGLSARRAIGVFFESPLLGTPKT